MITEVVKLLPLVESGSDIVMVAKGRDAYPTTVKELFQWIKRYGRWLKK